MSVAVPSVVPTPSRWHTEALRLSAYYDTLYRAVGRNVAKVNAKSAVRKENDSYTFNCNTVIYTNFNTVNLLLKSKNAAGAPATSPGSCSAG